MLHQNNLIAEDKLQFLIKQYLEYKLGSRYSEDAALKLTLTPLREAIEYFIKTDSADYLAISAITSINSTATRQEHQANRNLLFHLLDESLEVNTNHGKEFVDFKKFNKQVAALHWEVTKATKINTTSLLSKYVTNPLNFGVAEKFLQKKLSATEWFSEIDIIRLRKMYGYTSENLVITTSEVNSIGIALHFARLKHKDQNTPYQVNFLLNDGEIGNLSSQGIHWVRMKISVTPSRIDPVSGQKTKAKVLIHYRDSMTLTESAKEKIQKKIRLALEYKETSIGTAGARVHFSAFTDGDQQVEFDIKDDGLAKQTDGWSCGYHAFSRLVIEDTNANKSNDKVKKLKRLSIEQTTSSNLREIFYSDLLSDARFSKEQIDKLNADKTLLEVSKSGSDFKINAEYANSLVKILEERKKLGDKIVVSAAELKKENKIISSAKNLESKIKKIISSQPDKNKWLINFKDIIEKDDSPETIKAKIKALANIIHRQESVMALSLQNVDRIALYSAEFMAEFDKLINVTDITFEENAASKHENLYAVTEALSGRNQLIKLINLPIEEDSEDDVWMQLCRKRISNPALFGDKMYLMRELNLAVTNEGINTSVEDKKNFNLINRYVERMGAVYLEKIFSFIDKNERFFTMRSGFDFESVVINSTHPAELKKMRKAIESIEARDEVLINAVKIKQRKSTKDYLDGLIKIFSDKKPDTNSERLRPSYFPFEQVKISLGNFKEEDFEKFIEILRLISKNQPGVNSVRISLMDDEYKSIDFTAAQYRKLRDLFESEKIRFSLQVVSAGYDLASHEDIRLISNIVINNRRQYNIQKRANQFEAVAKSLKENLIDSNLRSSEATSPKYRPYKNKNFDIRQDIKVDAQQELEIQHQHQSQTQLEQEIQQENQVDEQAENEIVLSAFQTNDPILTDRKKYSEEMESHMRTLGLSLPKESRSLSHLVQEKLYNLSPIFWDMAIAKHDLKHSVKFITANALSKIQSIPQHFAFGLQLDNLPVGFYLEQCQEDLVLCYDETKFIENKNESPLTVKVKTNPVTSRWNGDLRSFIPDESDPKKIITFDNITTETGSFSYRKISVAQLKAFMRGLNADLAQQIFLNHTWLLDNPEIALKPQNIFSFIDVLYYEGCEGLAIFFDALKSLYNEDKDLFKHFKSSFLDQDGVDSVMPLMMNRNLDIIKKLSQMSRAEKAWWTALVTEHKKSITQIDLAELYEGFQYFLKKLPEGTSLPIPCPIESVQHNGPANMLVFLDRLLAILGKIKPKNLRDQLDHLSGLSFDQEGAWYATRWEGFKYVHQAMGLRPEAVNQKFEKTILGKEQITYKVEFADLIAIAKSDAVKDLSYPNTLFHRFVGRSQYINKEYSNYIELTTKISDAKASLVIKKQLLALLALVTTSERGVNHFDTTQLIELVEKDNLEPILATLLGFIQTWEVKPTVDELTALIALLQQAKTDPKNMLAIFKIGSSSESFNAILNWTKNKNHSLADDYANYSRSLTMFFSDKGIEKYVYQMLATIKNVDSNSAYLGRLITVLDSLQEKKYYLDVLQILASIDLEKTNHDQLPTMADLFNVIKKLAHDATITDANQAYITISTELPSCHFNLSNDAVSSFEADADLLSKLQEVNEHFRNAGLEEIDSDRLYGDNAIKYLQDKIDELGRVGKKKVPGWNILKDSYIYPSIIKTIRSVLFGPIINTISKFPALAALQSDRIGLLVEPELSKEYNKLAKDIASLNSYAKNVLDIFTELSELKNKFGNDFNLDFLANSVKARQLSVAQLKRLLMAIKELEISYVPTTVLNSIFSGVAYQATLDKEDIISATISILDLPKFTLAEKADLISLVNKNSGMAKSLIQQLNEIKSNYAEFASSVIKMISHLYKNTLKENAYGTALMDSINALLKNQTIDKTAKKIIFDRLANNSLDFIKILDVVDLIQPKENGAILLKVIAYTFLEKDDNYNQFDIDKLAQLFIKTIIYDQSGNTKFKILESLYANRPYPSPKRLETFLNLPSVDNMQSFAKQYELDPPGLRTQGDKAKSEEFIRSQFDRSTAHTRVDQIRDLGRGHQDHYPPLYYTQRKELFNHFIYVNSVGLSKNTVLSVPGNLDNKDEYKKVVGALTKSQIQTLIKHYRAIISNPNADEKEKLAAKLEFAALAREAMYRTAAIFPYSTQMIALLNVMLNGGDIYSKMRTGEGKGGVTALFAAFKWMEGGAVDVCSSNMELALRDLEEFSGFFEYLGVPISLINAKSQFNEYQQDGINYSDVAQMELFLEKMELAHEDLPKKVSLILDEADRNALDNKSQFRYAINLDSASDPHNNPNEWAYPIILKFISTDKFLNVKCPPEQDIENLREFVKNRSDLTASEKSKFTHFSNAQLDKWIDSAYLANALVEKEDFSIDTGVIIREGQEINVQFARVKDNFRESRDSTFSDGVHQFLHTKLNLEIKNGKRSGHQFPIEPEKTYLASRSSKNFIDYYKSKGNVLGLTGTIGSAEEIAEMQRDYGFKFYSIPPHKELMRIDHPPKIAKKPFWLNEDKAFTLDENIKFNSILEQIKKAQEIDQPILVICKSVEYSEKLHRYLQKRLNAEKLQLYNGEQRNLREKDVVKKAGSPRMVTITTPMLGRGTDIKPRDEFNNPIPDGLCVIDTFIDPDRDYEQKIGRSGRNGEYGDTILILSAADLKEHGVAKPESLTSAELQQKIAEIRLKLNNQNAEQRRVRQLFADVKEQFFNEYIRNSKMIKDAINTSFRSIRADGRETWTAVQREAHLLWEGFLNTIDKKWKSHTTDFENERRKIQSPAEIDTALLAKIQDLTQFANKEWKKMMDEITSTSKTRLALDFAAAQERVSTSTQPSMMEPKEINIPSFQAIHVKPDATTPIYDAPPELEFAPLTGKRLNPFETYIKIANIDIEDKNKNADILAKALNEEFQIAFKDFYPDGNLEEKYKELFAVPSFLAKNKELLSDSATSYTTKVNKYKNVVIRTILNEMHRIGTEKATPMLSKIIQRLMVAIAKYETNEGKESIFMQFNEELIAHKSDLSFTKLLLQTMASMKELGAIQDWVNIDILYASHEVSAWSKLKENTLNKLNEYLGSSFLSNDRKLLVKTLVDQIKKIKDDENSIENLLSRINLASTALIEGDYAHDQSTRFFSYRGKQGSRLQDSLSNIHDEVISYLINSNKTNNASLFKNEIMHLKSMLNTLLKRAKLDKISKNKTAKEISDDSLLNQLVLSINENDINLASKNIMLIYNRLKSYRVHSYQTGTSKNAAEEGFHHFLADALHKLNSFRGNKFQAELLIPKEERNDLNTVFLSRESEMRDKIQTTVKSVLQKGIIPSKDVYANKYTSLFAGDSINAKLLRIALVDIASSLKSQYPEYKSVVPENVAFDEKVGQLNLTFIMHDKHQKQTTQIDITIESFNEKSPDSLLCLWPTIKPYMLKENNVLASSAPKRP